MLQTIYVLTEFLSNLTWPKIYRSKIIAHKVHFYWITAIDAVTYNGIHLYVAC